MFFRKPDVMRLKRAGNVAALVTALSYHKDVSVQVAAAEALGEVGDQAAIEPLMTWLRNARSEPYPDVVIESITKIGGPTATDALLKLLANPPEPIPERRPRRDSAYGMVAALGRLGDQRAIQPLATWLRNAEYHGYRHAAIESIRRIGGPAATDALLELVANPPEPVPERGGTARGKHVEVDAAQALAELGDQRAIGPLTAWLRKATNNELRAVATRSLGKIGGPATADVLLEVLAYQPEPTSPANLEYTTIRRWQEELIAAEEARANAAQALAELGDQRAIAPLKSWVSALSNSLEHLTAFLFNSSEFVIGRISTYRDTAIHCIGRIDGPAAAEVLLEFFIDPPGAVTTGPLGSEALRVSVANALSEIGEQRAIGPLKTWLYETSSSKDRELAIDSISKIAGPAAVDFLLELLSDKRFAGSAVAALAGTGDPRAVPTLCELLSEKLKVGDYSNVPRIAEALGELGDRRAVPVLCDLLELAGARGVASDWNDVAGRTQRMGAAEALERIGDPRALPVLQRVLARLPRPPTEQQLEDASRDDFVFGYELVQAKSAEYHTLSHSIAVLGGQPHPGEENQFAR